MTKNMYSTFHGKKKSYKVGNFVINPIIRGRTVKSVIKWDKTVINAIIRGYSVKKGIAFFHVELYPWRITELPRVTL